MSRRCHNQTRPPTRSVAYSASFERITSYPGDVIKGSEIRSRHAIPVRRRSHAGLVATRAPRPSLPTRPRRPVRSVAVTAVRTPDDVAKQRPDTPRRGAPPSRIRASKAATGVGGCDAKRHPQRSLGTPQYPGRNRRRNSVPLSVPPRSRPTPPGATHLSGRSSGGVLRDGRGGQESSIKAYWYRIRGHALETPNPTVLTGCIDLSITTRINTSVTTNAGLHQTRDRR